MREINRVVFVCENGTGRAPMATEILNNTPRNRQIEAVARGLVVQWPEPMNQKAEAVLISKGMKTEGYMTSKLTESDFTETTWGIPARSKILKYELAILS